MSIIVHHQPISPASKKTLHVWQATSSWDIPGTLSQGIFHFKLPDHVDPRKMRFKFFETNPDSDLVTWEPEDFVRIIRLTAPTEVWTFDLTGRVLYSPPVPSGVTYSPGQELTVNLVTRKRFEGGLLYIWSPYHPGSPSMCVSETARDKAAYISTFRVGLAPWMKEGFHFKFARHYDDGTEYWEPDSSNRVWRPVDGLTIWCKSGQVSIRKGPLSPAVIPVEVLLPANLNPPPLSLHDPVDDFETSIVPSGQKPYDSSGLFQNASYQVQIYPDAAYTLATGNNLENPVIVRPFPADPADYLALSRFALGVDGWMDKFPPVVPSATLKVKTLANSSFAHGLSAQIALGSGPSYLTVQAKQEADGSWKAPFHVAHGLKTSVRLSPANGHEQTLYPWIDTARFFVPPSSSVTVNTTEGVFGLAMKSGTTFAEVPVGRKALMEAAFGKAITDSGVFAPEEMPHGPTRLGNSYYFVIHAPHAVVSSLILVDEKAPGGPARRIIPMSLTPDVRYWWCSVSAAQVPPRTRYRFALNDTTEVMDPAAREVLDRPKWETFPDDDPSDHDTSWSLVIDVDGLRTLAHQHPWQTMGWESLLIYELHARRFTDIGAGPLPPLDVVADELKPINRMGKPGYLNQLPVTALELLPVHEFKSNASWGYSPAFYFAIDSSYGGAEAFADMIDAAHQSNRGVILDVVYNHSLDSPLMKIARDVYRNGDSYGDRMNCGHPMVREFLRQATIYLWYTFGFDGLRFDDTKTIVSLCEGGWDFLGAIRSALETAATAEGRTRPYCVAENDPKPWDMSNPAWDVLDGEWDIDEVYRIRDASYCTWSDTADTAGDLKREMDNPNFWNRPFYEAVRYGESHDMVSGQDSANKRIACRPPYGQGLRMAKALGTVTLLSNGVPMLFMGQEVGETRYFSFDNNGPVTNPQNYAPWNPPTDNTRILGWFQSLMGLRNDTTKGLKGNDNYQVVRTGRRTVAFTCGQDRKLFAIVTFGTPDTRQDSSWLGLPDGAAYKEIFNSSWPVFQVESEEEHTNGGYNAGIVAGQVLNLPSIGAVVLERRY